MAAGRRFFVRWKWALIALGGVLALLLLTTVTSLGLAIDFPPAVWWAHRLNRWEFERHAAYYREVAAAVTRDMAGVQPGATLYYEGNPSRGASAVKRLELPVPEEVLNRLFRDAILIEAHRFGKEIGIRFVTRRPWSGSAFSLIYWDPAPYPSLVWGPNPWTEIPRVDWIDSRWWSGYLVDGSYIQRPYY
jgi:hypothetical protein